MVSRAEVLAAQATASQTGLTLCAMVLFLHGMGLGPGLGYGGLVVPHHTAPGSGMLLLSPEDATWFNSVTPLAMGLGVLVSIPVSERLGRKRTLLLCNIISIVGYVALHLAPSFLVLVVARCLQCTGLGLGAMTTGVYLQEIAVVKLRGPLVGASQTSFCTGLLCYTAISRFLPAPLLSLVLAGHHLLVVLLLLLLPPSPQWLMRQGREQEAGRSLQTLRGQGYPGLTVELEEIRKCTKERQALAEASVGQALRSPSFRSPLILFSVIFFLLGTCGNDTMVYYGPTIFSRLDLGIEPGLLATLPWVGFTLGYALSSPLMARLGGSLPLTVLLRMKRVTQFVSCAGLMSASMTCLGLVLLLLSQGLGSLLVLRAALVTSLMVATTSYGLGVGAVPYTMVGELFTPEHRTLGSCTAQVVR